MGTDKWYGEGPRSIYFPENICSDFSWWKLFVSGEQNLYKKAQEVC